jgi:hypothetical protein
MWIALLVTCLAGTIAFVTLALGLHPDHAGSKTELASWFLAYISAIATTVCAWFVWRQAQSEKRRKRELIKFDRDWTATRHVRDGTCIVQILFLALGHYDYFKRVLQIRCGGTAIPVEQRGESSKTASGYNLLQFTTGLELIREDAELEIYVWVQMGADKDVWGETTQHVKATTQPLPEGLYGPVQ